MMEGEGGESGGMEWDGMGTSCAAAVFVLRPPFCVLRQYQWSANGVEVMAAIAER